MIETQTRRRRPAAAEAKAARPRTKPSEVRRRELLDAGEALVLRKGIAGTSIDDIVAAADVAKGTFYLYFTSKEALVEALRERFSERFSARIASAQAKLDPADWSGRLAAWLEGGVRGYLDQVELHDVLFHTPDFLPRQRRVDGHMEPVRGLVELLRDGAAAGAWAVADAEMTAVLLFYAFHGGVDHAIAEGRTADVAGLVAELQAFFLRALGLSPEEASRAVIAKRPSA
ncbi:TetR/AcrR family transcriptional regulator [Inquilinus limosus]|uniref:TetR/AcrR family transcriptional regulator n=1 Tax=Inquilinus limosus TaxID=171674 RepID=UPI0003FB5CDD|nr:TetR/AcrR family transcriptional regulator [Inquilinus limosus]